jgi:membrane protease YdiL (CAAX protease family)
MNFQNTFSEENPFHYIKVRHIFLCYLLISFYLVVEIVFIYYFPNIYMGLRPNNNSLSDYILLILITEIPRIFTIAWIVRQLELIQVKTKPIIGKVPSHYGWLPIIGLVIIRLIFSAGCFRVLNYPLSFIFPSLIERYVHSNFFTLSSGSFSPPLYYCLLIIDAFIISPVAASFIFQGIILHRWSAKWGIRPAILMISILYSLYYMIRGMNLLGGLSLGLMQTMLYIKSRTLIVPILARIINNAIFLLLDYLYLSVENSIEQFRSHLEIGLFCIAVSTPLLIWILYKNRIRPNEQLPYFANINSSSSID